ncbi:MAG TPA: hypothetical protein VND97_05110, partial [Beijerinckiaceae bacterium]|nr:hypothetical protein [Beijerinckiaceae bacterium]
MQDDKVKTIADRILRAHLASFDYEGVDVRSGYDQDDEPALFIDAILGANAPAALGSALIDAHYQINKELLADGEER